MTEKPIENETENVPVDATENETVTSDLPEEVVNAVRKRQQLTIEAVRKSQQLTYERAKKLAEALSAAAAKLPGRQFAHRLPAPPFADGLPKLPKLPESDAVRIAARDYASRLFAEQRRFAHEVVAEQRRFAGELVSAVSASHPAGHDGEATPSAE